MPFGLRVARQSTIQTLRQQPTFTPLHAVGSCGRGQRYRAHAHACNHRIAMASGYHWSGLPTLHNTESITCVCKGMLKRPATELTDRHGSDTLITADPWHTRVVHFTVVLQLSATKPPHAMMHPYVAEGAGKQQGAAASVRCIAASEVRLAAMHLQSFATS